MLSNGLVLILLAISVAGGRQDDRPHSDSTVGVQDASADDRIGQLEARVDRLEKLLFNTISLTVFDAQRQLADAQRNLENSQKLFLQGFITEAQLAQERFNLRRAERELELARSEGGGRRIAMEIEVMQAERNLQIAKEQLQFSERLATRGYSSLTEIQKLRERELQFEKELELARQRLAAVNEILDQQEGPDAQPTEPKGDDRSAPDQKR